ncbi:unnamed protein product [Oreochromis niloticus]|nr:unnamed protein product [Mustela putorius furo]
MESLQPLRDEVSAALWQLEREHLVDVCRRLKCSGLDTTESHSKTKRTLIRLAEGMFDDVEKSEEEDQVKQFYKDIAVYIQRLSKGECQSEREPHGTESGQKKDLENTACATPVHIADYSPRARPEAMQTLQEVTLKREFKICGQIGEHGQKDKLSYLSLICQIENGSEKGHSETEIVEAVIRAISPGTPLRDMLEIKQPKETALNFVFCAIELKEKLLWKAANEETDELYSRATIQRKFLHSIETGLLSDSIKYQLLSPLNDITITDEELIEKVNKASKLENERFEKRKRSTATKIPKVQELQTECQTALTSAQSPSKPRESPATVAMTTVKNKETKTDTQQIIEELRNEMKQMFMAAMETSPCTMAPKQREKGYKKCKEEEKGENCLHCFKCGREGHYSRGCRAPRLSSGNGEGLLRWDQQ